MIGFLVEDDLLKAERLRQFILQACPRLSLRTFGSFQTGLRAIEQESPDVVLLDMTLPTFDRLAYKREGRLRPLGGYDLMRKLQLHGINCQVIVITQLDAFGEGAEKVTFQEITKRCEQEFPDMFAGSVYFRQSIATWQTDLLKLLDKIS